MPSLYVVSNYVHFLNAVNNDFDILKIFPIFLQTNESNNIPLKKHEEDLLWSELERVQVLDRPWETWLQHEKNRRRATLPKRGPPPLSITKQYVKKEKWRAAVQYSGVCVYPYM